MNMLDFLMAASEMVLTKDEFGQKMHDPSVTDSEKEEILRQVKAAGGYDNLED